MFAINTLEVTRNACIQPCKEARDPRSLSMNSNFLLKACDQYNLAEVAVYWQLSLLPWNKWHNRVHFLMTCHMLGR